MGAVDMLLIGVMVGAVAALLVVGPRARAAARLRSRVHELERLLVEARAVRGREVLEARGPLEREIARLEAELRHERGRLDEKLAVFAGAREDALRLFQGLSAEALEANSNRLIELAQAQLAAARTAAHGDLETRERRIADLVAPLREGLQRVDGQLRRIELDRRESGGALAEQLRLVAEGQERLRGETGALVAALRQPLTRGRWGEMQLRRVVEMAGMLAYCDFTEQATAREDDGRVLRPDLVVRMPGGKRVVVDAKAPLQAFIDAYEASDEAERRRHLETHARHLRDHVRRLSAKAYWSQFAHAPDLVFLFLPGEHFYNAALEADPGLIEDAVAQSVLVATPTTLIALLRAVGYGWQQERVAESARAVSELGRELHARLTVLVEHVDKVGRRLNATVGAYNDAVGSLESRVLVSARRFAEHGAVSPERALGTVIPLGAAARPLAVEPRAPDAARDGDDPPQAGDAPGRAVVLG